MAHVTVCAQIQASLYKRSFYCRRLQYIPSVKALLAASRPLLPPLRRTSLEYTNLRKELLLSPMFLPSRFFSASLSLSPPLRRISLEYTNLGVEGSASVDVNFHYSNVTAGRNPPPPVVCTTVDLGRV